MLLKMNAFVGISKAIVGLTAFVIFILLIKNVFYMVREIRPGTRLFRDLYGSSANVIFLKRFLTDKGRVYRRKVILYGCIVFPLAYILVTLDKL